MKPARVVSLADELRSTLLAARNPDGGWPYYKGKASRLEPTCLAILALGSARTDAARGVAVDTSLLDAWPRRDGLFLDGPGEINYAFNGLAGVVLSVTPRRPIAADLESALVRARAVQLPPSTVNRQDNAVQAWPWFDGTFSWVESTAWCLLALKRLSGVPRAASIGRRLEEGQRFLADRVCSEGGWNYGNSNVFGSELTPQVPTTALALLSLQDVKPTPYIARSLSYLETHQQEETGGMALSFACIGLAIYDKPYPGARAALEQDWRRGRFLDNLHVTALALYALGAGEHRCEALRV